jgi:hypothetical protein
MIDDKLPGTLWGAKIIVMKQWLFLALGFAVATAAGPALSPYLSFQTWSTPLVALAPHTLEMVVASISLWILVAV